jgi:hypothetical protein
MKTQISTIKPAIDNTAANPAAAAASPTRMWSTAERTSRADVAMVSVLSADAIDAAFDEENFTFVTEATPVVNESSTMVQSLSSQLAMLESQCEQLRKILDTVSAGS